MPDPTPIPENTPEASTPRNSLNIGDSIGLAGLLVGVVLVIIVPPLLMKAVLLVGVCVGVPVFVQYSHWSHGWSKLRRCLAALVVIIVLLSVGIPEFITQWKTEHPTTVTIVSPVANAKPQSAPPTPSPAAVTPIAVAKSKKKSAPKREALANPNSAPVAAAGPTNSVVENSGKMYGTEISGAEVTAPPNGTATVLRNLPGGETSNTTIENPHVSSAPFSAPPSGRPPIEMTNTVHSLMMDNEVCGPPTAIHTYGANSGDLVKNMTVNGPSCDWHSFLDVVKTHREDMTAFMDKWEATMLSSWASLPPDKVEYNRKELESIRGQLIEGASDEGKFNAVLQRLWKNVPTFDVEMPE